MRYSKRFLPPIVAAAITTIVLTNISTVKMIAVESGSRLELFEAVWPIALTSTVAVILVMSLLYRSLADLVGDLEQREQAAQHHAYHDPLTSLPNRLLLEERLEQALNQFRREKRQVALLMLDLDRFKQVNDTLGHHAGDDLVRQVAGRLRALLRETDTIARIGGDEFAIIQATPKGAADVARLCERIIASVREPYLIGDKEARVGISIGATLARDDLASAQDLLRKADITMYSAKAAGRDCYRIFSEELDEQVQRRQRIEERLRAALQSGSGIELHYQPQISGRSCAVVGAEALIRWSDPDMVEVQPAEIVAIAEECGLIDALGEIVFRNACAAARRWPDLFIAVNLSPLQFRSTTFPETLKRIAEQENVPCDQFELEISENLLIDHGHLCHEAIETLRASGFRIVLDDFGTGYSALSYLSRVRIDKIKLDRSFINTERVEQTVAILRAAVTLGHALGLEVVAEGIAEEAQQALALEAGCDNLQGHLYAPALREAQLEELLSRGSQPIWGAAA